jgi:nitrate reductase NapD
MEPRKMAEETVHIASLLIHIRPELLDAVKTNLRQLDGLELHQESPQGKLVVVLETQHERHILDRIDQINSLPGVLNTALVYHELLTLEGESE